jgi:GNAT superfamily N-acetyltransferase
MIAALEEISLNALPALQTFFYDGWIVRMSKGHSRRANSVQTFGASKQSVQEKISYCERLYRQNNLLVVFKMTPASKPANLDTELEARGYHREGRTSVQTSALDPFGAAPSENVRISEQWDDEWYDSYCQMNSLTAASRETLKTMLRLVLPQTAYASVGDENGVRACGMGVLQERYLGLFDIVVDANVRRRGYGKQIVTRLLDWGKANGAQTAYLQVMCNNEPALKLYSQLGFVEQYQYWYRVHV